MPVASRGAWALLAAVVATTWAALPYMPPLGRAALATPLGAWGAGWGLVAGGAAGASWLAWRVHRAAAPAAVRVLLAATLVGWALALARLPGRPIERIHLLEYAAIGWLGWRAVRAHVAGEARALVVAIALGAALGWAEELVQAVTPGRYYDLRDVAMNALGATLGLATLAVVRATRVSGG
jgi:VanZ family protein